MSRAGAHAPPDEHRPRVLVVDDRPDNLLAVRAVLEPLGVELVEVTSGEAALRALLEGDFAVILLDVHMPGLDGFETASVIKERPRSRETPIIFLTAGQADVDQIGAGYEAGAVDFLLKPLDPTVLRSKVQVFAALDRQRRQLAQSDELVRNAFGAAPSGMAVCDCDGTILRANPALSSLTGGRAAPGVAVTELLGPPDARRLAEVLGSPGSPEAEGGRKAWLGTVHGPEGQAIPAYLIATWIRGLDGDPQQLLLTARDERDRQIATTLQRALLPERLPAVPGLSVAAHVSPGGHGTQVGGDWYDAIALPGGRLGVVVGDVAGRGIEAAARMGELRSVARAYALEGHEPVQLVERMNGYHSALGADLMTTLLYAVFEVDSGMLRFVNAGHPPPLVAAHDGSEPALLDGAGPPLGVLDTWRYEEHSRELPRGAVTLLYTDGLVERRGESLDTGLARLRRILSEDQGEVTTLCGRLFEAMEARDADDDVTCVVVRNEPVLGPVAKLKLGPDGRSLRLLRRVMHRWLEEVGADRDEVNELVMAANEAWQNALEHGTGLARTTIDVDLEARGGEVVVCVRDAGRRDREPSDPDRGRGIKLMQALTDDVMLDLGPHGSSVRMRRRLRSAPAAGDGASANRSASAASG